MQYCHTHTNPARLTGLTPSGEWRNNTCAFYIYTFSSNNNVIRENQKNWSWPSLVREKLSKLEGNSFLPLPFVYNTFILSHSCISRQTCLQHPKIHRLKTLPIMHHWMWQIVINCTLLHHHLSLSGKTQVSLCDKSPNQYISLGLQVICSWVMWNLSQVSQHDKINNQAAQKVFLLNSGHKKATQKWKCELNTDHTKLETNSGIKK